MKIMTYQALVEAVRRRCFLGNEAATVYVDGIPEEDFRAEVALSPRTVAGYRWKKARGLARPEEEADFQQQRADALQKLAQKPLVVFDKRLKKIGETGLWTRQGSSGMYLLSRPFQTAVDEMLDDIHTTNHDVSTLVDSIFDIGFGAGNMLEDAQSVEYVQGATELADFLFAPEVLPEVEKRLGFQLPYWLEAVFLAGVLKRDDWVVRLRSILEKSSHSCPNMATALLVLMLSRKRSGVWCYVPKYELETFFTPGKDWKQLPAIDGIGNTPIFKLAASLSGHPEYLVPLMFRHFRTRLVDDKDKTEIRKELQSFHRALGQPLSAFKDGDGHDVLWHLLYNGTALLYPQASPELFTHKPEFIQCFLDVGCDADDKGRWGVSWNDIWHATARYNS